MADFLEEVDPKVCAKYIEFLIEERNEVSENFHDRLADIYLHLTLNARKTQPEGNNFT